MKLTDDDAILVLDTSAPLACVGVARGRRVCAEVQLVESRRHAELLPAALEKVLALANCDFSSLSAIAVGKGPGSFVGLRVAMATAKGIALAQRIPLFGIDTLAALAGADDVPNGEGVAFLDARRGEIYAQRVSRRGESVFSCAQPVAIAPNAIADHFFPSTFRVGNGLALLPQTPVDTVDIEAQGPTVQGLARAFWTLHAAGIKDERHELVPAYCRAPDAKLPSVR